MFDILVQVSGIKFCILSIVFYTGRRGCYNWPFANNCFQTCMGEELLIIYD